MAVDFTIHLKDDASTAAKPEPSARTILNEMDAKPTPLTHSDEKEHQGATTSAKKIVHALEEEKAKPSPQLNQDDKDKDAGGGVTSAKKIIQTLDDLAALVEKIPVVGRAISGARPSLRHVRQAMDAHKRLSAKDAAEKKPQSRTGRPKKGRPSRLEQPQDQGEETEGGESAEVAEAAEGAEAVGGGEVGAGIGLGGIAAVAAPIAGVVLAAKAAAVGLETLTGGVREAAEQMAQFAGNNNVRTLANATDMAATSLRAIPIVGKDLENTVKNVTATFVAVDTAARSFVERGKQISGFSGDLSRANAEAEVRSLMADIREANELGPEIAKLTDQQSQFDAELRAAMLPIKKVIVEILTETIGELRAWMPQIKSALLQGAITLEEISIAVAILTRQDQAEILRKYQTLATLIGKAVADANKKPPEEGAEPFIEDQMRSLANAAFGALPNPGALPNAMPVFGPVGL